MRATCAAEHAGESAPISPGSKRVQQAADATGGKSEQVLRTVSSQRCGLDSARCTLHSARCILHSARCILHSACCILHVARCILHLARCILQVAFCTLHFARCLPVVHAAVACCTLARGMLLAAGVGAACGAQMGGMYAAHHSSSRIHAKSSVQSDADHRPSGSPRPTPT